MAKMSKSEKTKTLSLTENTEDAEKMQDREFIFPVDS
jgi:hypothetical protein